MPSLQVSASPACPRCVPGRVSLRGLGTAGVVLLVPRRSTECFAESMSTPEITQRDLQSRSREIMDAVECGESFIVTRDGYAMGELIPLRRRRKFVSRQEFAAMPRNAPVSDLDAFRADQNAVADHEESDRYER